MSNAVAMDHKEHMYHCDVKSENMEVTHCEVQSEIVKSEIIKSEIVESGIVKSEVVDTSEIAKMESEIPSIYVEETGDLECHEPELDYEVVITPAYLIRTHTGKRPFLCQTCNTAVWPKDRPSNRMQLLAGCRPIVRHVYYMNFTRKNLTVFNDRKEKPKGKGPGGKTAYACGKCGKVLRHKSHFDAHLRMHSGEKPFTCTYCSKSFGQKSNLTSHIKRHFNPTKANAAGKTQSPRGGNAAKTSSISINEEPHGSSAMGINELVQEGSSTLRTNVVSIKNVLRERGSAAKTNVVSINEMVLEGGSGTKTNVVSIKEVPPERGKATKTNVVSIDKVPGESSSATGMNAISINEMVQEGGGATKTNAIIINEDSDSPSEAVKVVTLGVNTSVSDTSETKASGTTPGTQELESTSDLPIVYVDMEDEYIGEVVIQDETLPKSDLSQTSTPAVVFKTSVSREKFGEGRLCHSADEEVISPPEKKRKTKDGKIDSSELSDDGDIPLQKKNGKAGSVLHSYATKNLDLVPSSHSASSSLSSSSSSTSKLTSVKLEVVKE